MKSLRRAFYDEIERNVLDLYSAIIIQSLFGVGKSLNWRSSSHMKFHLARSFRSVRFCTRRRWTPTYNVEWMHSISPFQRSKKAFDHMPAADGL